MLYSEIRLMTMLSLGRMAKTLAIYAAVLE